MPRRDGTGPIVSGQMTQKGLGFCNANIRLSGSGYACKSGYRWLASGRDFSKSKKELLEQRKEILKNQLEQIEKRLEDI